MGKQSVVASKYVTIVSGILILLGLYLASLYSYLLFHSLTEIFSIVVAFGIFMVAWNSRRFLDNNYLLFLGIAYLSIGSIDLVHTLAYKGMGIFQGYGANLPTQLWISARYMEGISLFIAPLLLDRRIKATPLLVCYITFTALLMTTIFYWHIFPDCFVEGKGLTLFKKVSEYVISLILIGSIVLLYQKRAAFHVYVYRLVYASIIVTICAELAFTFYISVYGLSNLIGHYFKIISFYLIYRALIETGLKRPYDLFFRDLKLSEELLRESEEKFRTISVSATDAIIMIDNDGNISFWNDSAQRIFGYSQKEVLGKEMHKLLMPQRYHEAYRKGFKAARTTGQGPVIDKAQELEGMKRSGEEFPLEVSISSVKLKGMWHFIGILRDITDRVHAEEQLEKGKVAAEAANRAKSDFLANMSHELRTPLNAIIGFSEILADKTFGQLTQKQERYVDNVLTSGRHLLQLINDILDLSKIEAGKMELERSKVDLKGLLENSMAMVKELSLQGGISHDLQVPDELEGFEFSGDERKLKQIIFNLLSNAIKFTPENGSIRLEANLISDFGFRISELEKEGKVISDQSTIDNRQSAIEISVADSGIGIEPEDQERIFGEFEQIDTSYAREQEGTGLGLALTRKLVELHGGFIWVESEGRGKGSTFTFVVPVETIEEEEVKPEIEKRDERKAVEGEGPLVLVVEDDRYASELLIGYLTKAGYSVAHAFDGEQAIQKARELKPCVITLDILLPKKNGLDVLSKLKSFPETREIPVIVISITEDRQLGFSMGAVEWFVKPVDKESLMQILRAVRTATGKECETVLVVDDEPKTVELLTDMLSAEGYHILQAYGGQQGIDLAIERLPDLIILDLLMPQVTGFEVVQRLREHPEARDIPILIHTAKDLTLEDRQQLNSHVQAVSSKSSGKEQLLSELEKVVKKNRNR